MFMHALYMSFTCLCIIVTCLITSPCMHILYVSMHVLTCMSSMCTSCPLCPCMSFSMLVWRSQPYILASTYIIISTRYHEGLITESVDNRLTIELTSITCCVRFLFKFNHFLLLKNAAASTEYERATDYSSCMLHTLTKPLHGFLHRFPV